MYIVKDTFLNRADGFGTRILPTTLDLNGAGLPAALEQLETAWSDLDRRAQKSLLAGLTIQAPLAPLCPNGPALLPGGALAIHIGVDKTLVCDPHSATILTDYAARRLRARVMTGGAAGGTNVYTVSYEGNGVVTRPGIPDRLPEQACTVIRDIAPFAGLIPALQPALRHGPVLIGWRDGGAVAWALTQAPAGIELTAALAGTAVYGAKDAPPATAWMAATLADRADRIAPALHDYLNDLLADQVSDRLRWDLCERAISGANPLAERLAAALQILPTHFTPNGFGTPGSTLLANWPVSAGALQTRHGLAMFGIRHQTTCLAVLGALRDVLENEGLFLIEHMESSLPHPAVLGRSTAENIASTWSDSTPCSALIAPPSDPSALFSLAHRLAERLDAEITIAAPAWGFYHRIDARTGADAGNAGWFGLGAGLDETEWL